MSTIFVFITLTRPRLDPWLLDFAAEALTMQVNEPVRKDTVKITKWALKQVFEIKNKKHNLYPKHFVWDL